MSENEPKRTKKKNSEDTLGRLKCSQIFLCCIAEVGKQKQGQEDGHTNGNSLHCKRRKEKLKKVAELSFASKVLLVEKAFMMSCSALPTLLPFYTVF